MAIENEILTSDLKSSRHLFLYINEPCVVMGRFQNPWIECNLSSMKSDNIKLVRRQSGGGCVYHDQDNVNFSFISDKELHDKIWNHKFIVNVLRSLKIDSIFSQRGDMRLDEPQKRKISGSAFKEKKDTAFHHGTMLINSDIDKLNHYIHSNKSGLESKSIQSIRSVVTNLKEKSPSITNDIFINEMAQSYCDVENIEHIDETHQLYIKAVSGEYLEKVRSFKWTYEETPKFMINEKCQNFEVEMTIKKTVIENIEISSKTIHPIALADFSKRLMTRSIFDKEIFSLGLDESTNEITCWLKEFFELERLP